MSLYKKFKTDPVLESEGVLYEVEGSFKLRIRRAGGANKRYGLTVDKALAPWRKPGKDLDKEDPKVRHDVFSQIFCEANYVEHSWETFVDGQYVKGVESEDGSIVPGTTANVLKLLQDLPDVGMALRHAALETDNYLVSNTKEILENLKVSSTGS